MKKRVLTRASGDPDSLVELLAARLGVERRQAKAWIDAGSVYIGGTRVAAPSPVAVGERVTVFVTAPPAAATEPVVVHRDEWIAVLDKPAGMPSQGEVSHQAGALEAFARRRLGAGARMLHRLDKEASGLVLF